MILFTPSLVSRCHTRVQLQESPCVKHISTLTAGLMQALFICKYQLGLFHIL